MSLFAALSLGARPFDLPAALNTWAATTPDHPVPEFKGKPRKKDDPTAEAWLCLIEQGCTARRVPKIHWPGVATHFMAKKARGRVVEVEKVMRALYGDRWAWTWKDFKVAVLNMGWSIDEKRTRQVNVERKATGLWRIVGGSKDDPGSAIPANPPKNGSGSNGAATPKKALADTKLDKSSKSSSTVPKSPVPSKEKGEKKEDKKDPRPKPSRSGSVFSLPALPFLRPAPTPEQSVLNKISAQVPLWLLAATEALSNLANENPDVLTAVATALVAVGTISTGGSAAVAAIGEAAVVVGRAIRTAHERANHRGQ